MYSLKRTTLLLIALITFITILNIELKQITSSSMQIPSLATDQLDEQTLVNANTISEHSVVPVISNDYKLNLERSLDCNLRAPENCHVINKSLVITFWGNRSTKKWLPANFLSIFPEKSFDYIIMVYDNSTWNHHPAYDKAIWIYVKNQLRFWYIKRFIAPHIMRAYRYIWIVDDDARFDFNPQAYECVLNEFNILLSAPGRLLGSISYLITRISPHYTSKIGRWTDFVETGPLVIANSSALACLWKYISEKVNSGCGLDLIWCRILSAECFQQISITKTCAILDTFAVDHVADTINTLDLGIAELPAYDKYYQNYKTKRQVFGAIARDSSVFDMCAEKLSTNQLFIL